MMPSLTLSQQSYFNRNLTLTTTLLLILTSLPPSSLSSITPHFFVPRRTGVFRSSRKNRPSQAALRPPPPPVVLRRATSESAGLRRAGQTHRSHRYDKKPTHASYTSHHPHTLSSCNTVVITILIINSLPILTLSCSLPLPRFCFSFLRCVCTRRSL